MTRRVLFLCTGNSARSVLAESTLKKWGEGRYLSFSAGSQPAGRVNPFAIAQLEREGFPVEGMRSKSWDEFAEVDAAAMDLIVTVCDSAAAEACPVVFGDFVRVHWGLHCRRSSGVRLIRGRDAGACKGGSSVQGGRATRRAAGSVPSKRCWTLLPHAELFYAAESRAR